MTAVQDGPARGQLMDALRGLGLDSPEGHCRELSNDAIHGTVKKAQHKQRQGERFGAGLIVTWLRQGGDEGFGQAVSLPQEWYRTYTGRLKWITQHVPDLDEDYAEIAVVSLVAEKRTPAPDLVRRFASLAEQQQKAHDGTCRIPLGGERKDNGATHGGAKQGADGSHPASASQEGAEARQAVIGTGVEA